MPKNLKVELHHIDGTVVELECGFDTPVETASIVKRDGKWYTYSYNGTLGGPLRFSEVQAPLEL